MSENKVFSHLISNLQYRKACRKMKGCEASLNPPTPIVVFFHIFTSPNIQKTPVVLKTLLFQFNGQCKENSPTDLNMWMCKKKQQKKTYSGSLPCSFQRQLTQDSLAKAYGQYYCNMCTSVKNNSTAKESTPKRKKFTQFAQNSKQAKTIVVFPSTWSA